MITVLTRATSRSLTTVGRLRSYGVPIAENEEESTTRIIAATTRSIERYCHRPTFGREELNESVAGYGDPQLLLSRTPIVNVASVTQRGEPVIDYIVQDPEAGLLYRSRGWTWTATLVGWDIATSVLPGSEEPIFSVTYTAGYLLPEDDLEATQELSVLASDSSFNLSSGSFPLLVPGDHITTTGFSIAANNGTFTVLSRTPTKVIVAGTLELEPGWATENQKIMAVSTLPEDLELATFEASRDVKAQASIPGDVASQSIGDLSITYRQQGGASGEYATPLSFIVRGRLVPYQRLVSV